MEGVGGEAPAAKDGVCGWVRCAMLSQHALAAWSCAVRGVWRNHEFTSPLTPPKLGFRGWARDKSVMMARRSILVLLVLAAASHVTAAAIPVEHSLDGGKTFVQAGTLTVHSTVSSVCLKRQPLTGSL